MSVFSRDSDDPTGHAPSTPSDGNAASPAVPGAYVSGSLRDCTSQARGLAGVARVKDGDIVVIDEPDVTRRHAELLANVKPSAVVNLSPFLTGVIPHYGPHLLSDASIALFEADESLRSVLRDAKKATVFPDGRVVLGRKEAGRVAPVEQGAIDEKFMAAQRSLLDHMEAYFGNTIEFIHSESPLLIDGVGVPEMGASISGRKVVIAAPSPLTREKIRGLRNFIREFEPVLIGVGSAADTLVELGYEPDFIVGNPVDIDAKNVRAGSRVVLPADPDGFVAGLERIQDLGIGAMTFPAATDSPLDLAVLLASFHDAELIVTVGDPVNLDAVFARREMSSPSALLSRLQAGERLVDSTVIEKLYAVQRGGGVAWAWAILGLLVALATVVVIVGFSGPDAFAENLVHACETAVQKFSSLLDWA